MEKELLSFVLVGLILLIDTAWAIQVGMLPLARGSEHAGFSGPGIAAIVLPIHSGPTSTSRLFKRRSIISARVFYEAGIT